MTVEELVKKLSTYPKDKRIVFWNETLDDNHWGVKIHEDNINNEDVVLFPTIEEVV